MNVKVFLAYIGSKNIVRFCISFRTVGASVWEEVGNLTAPAPDEPLVWSLLVADDRFLDSKIELQVAAINNKGYVSNSISQMEEIGMKTAVFKSDDPYLMLFL